MIFDWNEHYKFGGKSGDPDQYSISRNWKKGIINKYCDITKDSLIDIGCGDLQFWDGKIPDNYTGIDISQVIIQKNKLLYPNAKFICSSATEQMDISANTVICFDMLWHIIDDDDYIKILQNIKKYSKNIIIIYTWNRNIFDKGLIFRIFSSLVTYKKTGILDFTQKDNDGGYQKYRDFLSIATSIFEPEFSLLNKHTNEYWTEGTMYIFKNEEDL